MAASLPILHNVAVTNINVSETTFTWSVNNFSFSPKTLGSKLYSPVFATTNDRNILWRLDLYPNGRDNSQNVFLYLHLVQCKKYKIDVTFEFSIINKNAAPENTAKSTITTFYEKSSYGFEFLLSRDYLSKNVDNLLPNDTLTIFCKIKARLGFQNAVAAMKIATVSASLDTNVPAVTTADNVVVPYASAAVVPLTTQTTSVSSKGLQLPINTAYNLATALTNVEGTASGSAIANYVYPPHVIYLQHTPVYARKRCYKRKRCYDCDEFFDECECYF